MLNVVLNMETITASEAAKRLEVSIQTVYRQIQSGRVRGFRRDGKWHVQLDTQDTPDVEHVFPRVQHGEQGVEHLNAEVQQLKAQVKQADFEGKHLTELIEEKTNQILYLRDMLTEKDDQMESLTDALNHAHQLVAISQKSIQHLTEQNQLLLEDSRHRKLPVWKRVFRWT